MKTRPLALVLMLLTALVLSGCASGPSATAKQTEIKTNSGTLWVNTQ